MGCCYYPRPRYQRKTPGGEFCQWCVVDNGSGSATFGQVPLAYEVVFPAITHPYNPGFPDVTGVTGGGPGGFIGRVDYCQYVAGSHRIPLDNASECRYVVDEQYDYSQSDPLAAGTFYHYVWFRWEITKNDFVAFGNIGVKLRLFVGSSRDVDQPPVGQQFGVANTPFVLRADYRAEYHPITNPINCLLFEMPRWEPTEDDYDPGGFGGTVPLCYTWPDTVTLEETL
jgi:hypothetical protein